MSALHIAEIHFAEGGIRYRYPREMIMKGSAAFAFTVFLLGCSYAPVEKGYAYSPIVSGASDAAYGDEPRMTGVEFKDYALSRGFVVAVIRNDGVTAYCKKQPMPLFERQNGTVDSCLNPED